MHSLGIWQGVHWFTWVIFIVFWAFLGDYGVVRQLWCAYIWDWFNCMMLGKGVNNWTQIYRLASIRCYFDSYFVIFVKIKTLRWKFMIEQRHKSDFHFVYILALSTTTIELIKYLSHQMNTHGQTPLRSTTLHELTIHYRHCYPRNLVFDIHKRKLITLSNFVMYILEAL